MIRSPVLLGTTTDMCPNMGDAFYVFCPVRELSFFDQSVAQINAQALPLFL
jgi:hypothetical protein